MAKKYKGEIQFPSNFKVETTASLDDRLVVDNFNDLYFIEYPYQGMVVSVLENNRIYMFISDKIIDAQNPNYWKCVGTTDVANILSINENTPDSGYGFRIEQKKDNSTTIENYINTDNEIRANAFYTSRGLNSYDETAGDEYSVDFIELRKGGDSYITLYNKGSENWIKLNIVDESLGFSLSDVKVKDADGNITSYENNSPVPVGYSICFGKNLSLIGMDESRGDDNYIFGEDGGSTYDNVDIYKEDVLPNVYAYHDGNEVKILTEEDGDEINDKIDNLGDDVQNQIDTLTDKVDNLQNIMMIDPDGDGSEEPSTLVDVIQSMNTAITALESLEKVETLTESDIKDIFESNDVNSDE